MPHLSIIKSGFFATIQDVGRFGVANIGVPRSGVMDNYAYRFANALLGNAENAAVLELFLQGGTFQCSDNTQIVVSGAECTVLINSVLVSQYQILSISPNDVLTIQNLKRGSIVYIGIKGGFQSEEHLGSRSFYVPITSQQRFVNGDTVTFQSHENLNSHSKVSVVYKSSYLDNSVIDVFKGPEYELLSPLQKQQLTTSEFTLSTMSNRMAYQFIESVPNTLDSMLTAPVLPGTIQLTPSGKLIVLMRDCQTTGGYPRVLQVSEKALNTLGQKKPNSKVTFNIIEF